MVDVLSSPSSVGKSESPTTTARRLISAGTAAALEQFEDPVLLDQGRVNLIALDAVIARFGDRWPLRRAQVYDQVERILQRCVGPHGYTLRVSESDYLICQPDVGRFSAQAACLRCLREILDHFLGDAEQADECVHQVTKVDPNGVAAARVDARRAEQGEQQERAAAAQAAIESHEPPGRTVDRWSPFVASDGRELRVSCTLEPVFELKAFGRIGFRMARRVHVVATGEELPSSQIANLSRSDILRIDLATIARGMDRLRAEADGERLPSLIVPVSFISLTNGDARAQIVALLKAAAGLVRRGVICEVCDIEGAPQGALSAAVSLIRPFSLFVVGRLSSTPPSPATVAQLKDTGLQALSLECPRRQGETEFIQWAEAAIHAARRATKSVLVYKTDSARYACLAGLMGATHASVRS